MPTKMTMPECPHCRTNESVKMSRTFGGEMFSHCLKCESRGPSNLYESATEVHAQWATIQRDREALAMFKEGQK